MLASITPLGERGRQSRWGLTMTAFALAAGAAGAAAGALAGALGGLAIGPVLGTRGRLAMLALALLAAALVDLLPGAAPGPRRQVNERWLDEFRGWVYGAGFGAQLGLGATTVVASAATYVALVAAALSASPASGALIVGGFGAVRGLTPLLAARVHTPGALLELHRRFAAWQPRARWATVAVLAVSAMLAGAASLP